MIKNSEDISLATKGLYDESLVPIFELSNVTGERLNMLLEFFANLKPRVD